MESLVIYYFPQTRLYRALKYSKPGMLRSIEFLLGFIRLDDHKLDIFGTDILGVILFLVVESYEYF